MKTGIPRIASLAMTLFLALASLLVIPAPVHAHAVLIDSLPRDNAVLQLPPREVMLRFNARIEKQIFQVTLLAGDGRKVPLPGLAGRRGDGSPDRLVIPLPRLAPGSYRLQYRILATDGHVTPGLLRFTVSGGGAQ